MARNERRAFRPRRSTPVNARRWTIAATLALTIGLVIVSATLAQEVNLPPPLIQMQPGTLYDSGICGSITITDKLLLCVQSPTTEPTATMEPMPTATPLPTQVPVTPAPSPATVPTAVPTLTRAIPVAGLPCPAWLHDSMVTTGPDGKLYPTWHPPVDLASGCLFGHEHGADPATSKVNASLPAFGYAAAQMGMTEPHTGYKVYVLNAGDTVESNVENKVSTVSVRFVFHQGTSSLGRYLQPIHSGQEDYSGPEGSFAVNGNFDTGPTALDGSTCDLPRQGAKDFSTLGCPDPYEIWNGAHFQIDTAEQRATCCSGIGQSILYVANSPAVFDPITTRDPLDLGRLIYTETLKGNNGAALSGINPTSPDAYNQGCRREFYTGPDFWRNAGGQTQYVTDPLGVVIPDAKVAGPGQILQTVSQSSSQTEAIFKKRTDYCGQGIHSPN